MSVATIVITATRANAPATTIINRGPTGPAGPAGPAGADSITSATTSDGTADINFNQVGIGTTNPSEKLTVHSTASAIATFYTTNASGGFTGYHNSTGGIKGFVGYGSTLFTGLDINNFGLRSQSGMPFATGGGNIRMYINSSGNVGIGTTSPTTKFEVNSGNTNNVAKFESTDSVARIVLKDNAGEAHLSAIGDDMVFATSSSGSQRMRITGAGNVGIGTTGPLQKLHVYGASNGASIYNAMFQNAGTAVGTSSKILFVSGGTTTRGADIGSLQEAVAGDATALTFGTSAAYATPTEKLRITSTGNVGIGTTVPSQKLDVDGAVKKAVFTVNTLPTATAGTSCYVSDSNHTHHSNVGQVVGSGGSNFVPVYYDGTDWRIG